MVFTFTDATRHALHMAREASDMLQHDYVGTEHLLAGLMQEDRDNAAAVLKNLDADPAKIRNSLAGIVGRGNRSESLDELPYTEKAKKTLEYAMDEARAMTPGSSAIVCTEHLLLGLLREEDGVAAGVLNSCGVTLDAARAEAVRLAAT